MSPITLYLDEATQALVEQAAKAHGLSTSRWVAGIIRKYAAQEWPQDCMALAGRFADFPLHEDGASQRLSQHLNPSAAPTPPAQTASWPCPAG